MICTQEDSFLDEKTIWIATLSDGNTVFQDDDREGDFHPSAWIRLKDHCDSKGVYIDNLSIRFRDHKVDVPKAEAYHFIKSVGCMVGYPEEHFFIVSLLKQGELVRTWYKVPEIVENDSSVVKAEDVLKYESLMIKGSIDG